MYLRVNDIYNTVDWHTDKHYLDLSATLFIMKLPLK